MRQSLLSIPETPIFLLHQIIILLLIENIIETMIQKVECELTQ